MIDLLLQRLARRLTAAGAGVRVEVCPPPFGPSRLDGLAAVKQEFAQQLADVAGDDAGLLGARIERARSMLELWHLRAAVFRLVSLHHSQDEADTRLARLNRHFPTRSPRSAFAPLHG